MFFQVFFKGGELGIFQETPLGYQGIAIMKVHNKFHWDTTNSLGFRAETVISRENSKKSKKIQKISHKK